MLNKLSSIVLYILFAATVVVSLLFYLGGNVDPNAEYVEPTYTNSLMLLMYAFFAIATVIGMIEAFDRIQQAGDISATIVAGGIKVALITTVTGLIVAIILQIFYNFILSRIESNVADMEDSSITMLDILTKFNLKHGTLTSVARNSIISSR